jgi:hypothetical protein
MSKKVSTCPHIDRGVLETARNVGLNILRVAKNALVEAIGRLTGAEPRTSLNSWTPVVVEGWAGI